MAKGTKSLNSSKCIPPSNSIPHSNSVAKQNSKKLRPILTPFMIFAGENRLRV